MSRNLLPYEVLDAQGDLLRRLDERQFQRLTNSIAAFHQNAMFIDLPTEDQKEIVDRLPHAENLRAIVKGAYAYQVTPDMCRVVEAAAEALDDSDKFDPTQAPTGCGFARFDSGLEVTDLRGMQMKINWLVWGPGERGTRVWMFNDTYTDSDEVNEYFKRLARGEKIPGSELSVLQSKEDYEMVEEIRGRWATVGTHVAFAGEELGPKGWEANEVNEARIREEGFEPTMGTNCSRLVQAFWLMLNQTIVETSDAHVERHGRKRAIKRGIPPQVTVIHLRRTIREQRQENESNVEWSHRWLVRGHWAWRVCGADHPQAQEAPVKGGIGVRVWIHPYQKGPEDAPLVITDKVYRLDH